MYGKERITNKREKEERRARRRAQGAVQEYTKRDCVSPHAESIYWGGRSKFWFVWAAAISSQRADLMGELVGVGGVTMIRGITQCRWSTRGVNLCSRIWRNRFLNLLLALLLHENECITMWQMKTSSINSATPTRRQLPTWSTAIGEGSYDTLVVSLKWQ